MIAQALIDLISTCIVILGWMFFVFACLLIFCITHPPKCYEGERPFVEPYEEEE